MGSRHLLKVLRRSLVLGLVLCCPDALATADGPACWTVSGVAANDTLNVRAAPENHAKVVGTIPPYVHPLKNLNEDPKSDMDPPKHPGWCNVQYKELVGWVGCRFLEINDECL